MSIIDELTPVYYKVLRIGLQPDGEGGIEAVGDFAIYNEAGARIGTDNPTVTLTAGERAAVLAFVERNADDYETATGLEPLPAGGES